jgi:hypothetical protein
MVDRRLAWRRRLIEAEERRRPRGDFELEAISSAGECEMINGRFIAPTPLPPCNPDRKKNFLVD